MILETFDLTKHYGKNHAVDGINLKIKKGSVYGLLGVNGAGKTTTMCMLSTILKPTKGDAIIKGFSVRKNKNKVRESIGVLPQDASLPQDFTVISVLEYFAALKGLKKLEKKEQVTSLMSALNLTSHANTKIKKLSHGMQKMITVAQAFFGNPSLILLDEPLSGLDPKYRKLVRDLINSVKGKSTILISTHLLEEVEILCDTVGILHKGKLKVQQSRESLKKKENFIIVRISNLKKSHLDMLKKMKNVTSINYVGELITIRTKKDISEIVLKKLVSLNAEITSYEKGMSAEDLFLKTISED